MLYIIKGFDKQKSEILDQAFRFRHEAFVEEAGWENLRRPDGREIDQFDTHETIHIVAIREKLVQAYSRLNPTTQPYVLSEIYPHLCSRKMIHDEKTWEWSRMGTSKSARHDGRGWGGPIGLLFRCVAYAALQNEIETLLWQAHPVWISRASELGFRPEPLGLPQKVAGERVIAAKMDVQEEVFYQMDSLNVPSTEGLTMSHILRS
jgi:acyl-homoserine lactone synthase